MSAVALVALVIASASASRQSDCRADERQALASATELMERGDEAAAVPAVERAIRAPASGCDRIRLARSALRGWFEARRLASQGGAVSLLGPVNQYLTELRAIDRPALSVELEYADLTIRAAVAAAQDERPEMSLLLEQARDLTERLVERGRRPLWPLPFNLLAGELWFEVDRYQEAATAYERATRADGSPAAFAGLGRSLEALGRHAEACRAYRQIGAAAEALRIEAAKFLAGCP
jgi:tetratricopeptide (TPR) repeat protein